MTITEWVAECHGLAVEKGWYDDGGRNVGEALMLVVTEIAEAMEEIRKGGPRNQVHEGEGGKPEGFPIELADAVIRIMDLCGAMRIDLENAIDKKHTFNKSRPYRHGSKRA